jgi:hypothetical protein
MVILAVLAGFGWASLGGLLGARQDLAAVRIRTALTHAQERAMVSNLDTWAVFDTAADNVSLFMEDPDNLGKAGRLRMPDPLTKAVMVVQFGEGGVGLAAAGFNLTTEVRFDQLGIPYDANDVQLPADGTVTLDGGQIIRVTRNTGLVTID